ncbi:substrate-binding domain-containing protein [Priestia flexa]|uniref:substrate-binding domain-containing protein n=1 Tax=Priestia flexa TaxID=86664 RepID=UPI001FF91191|nr:substrate-binding domain-containing protein [Priestia flexa]
MSQTTCRWCEIIQGIRKEDPYLKEILENDMSCVLIDIPFQTNSMGYVTTDNAQGGKKTVEHLIQQGRKSIGMINGHESAYVSEKRLKGYKEKLNEFNIPIIEKWTVNGGFEEIKSENITHTLLTIKTNNR